VKVVLDTNVFISGVFFGGPPYLILQAWRDGIIQLVISPEILDEYRRVGEILAEEHPGVDLEPMLEFVSQIADVFAAPPLSERVCEDPDDDKFISCALASASRVIISGDKHLLKETGFQDIEVLKPRDFPDRYL
jgi:putative PIN family toxin of toxin-antitoxin system